MEKKGEVGGGGETDLGSETVPPFSVLLASNKDIMQGAGSAIL